MTLHASKPLQAKESEMLVRPRKYGEKPLEESRIRKNFIIEKESFRGGGLIIDNYEHLFLCYC